MAVSKNKNNTNEDANSSMAMNKSERRYNDNDTCTAIAPSSTANLGPGYDVFGLALDALYDTVKIAKSLKEGGGNRITIKMSVDDDDDNSSPIPESPDANSAGLVVKKMMQDFHVSDNLKITVKKGVPAGFGMGSSAASAAAASVAFDGLYNLNLDKKDLVRYAAEGEVASAGSRHYDNVSASVFGGFVISTIGAEGGLPNFVCIKPPADLFMVVAVPKIPVPAKKTEVARSVLPSQVPLKSLVHNVSHASTIVAGFALGDAEMIAKGIDDIIIEPARKHMIPGYDRVKKRSLEAGSLAVTISGAGPSMIAFLKGTTRIKNVTKAMEAGFEEVGVKCQTFACGPSNGARLVEKK